MHAIHLYIKRPSLCSITFSLMNLQCAGGLLVMGHCKEAPFPAPKQAQDQCGECEGAAILHVRSSGGTFRWTEYKP